MINIHLKAFTYKLKGTSSPGTRGIRYKTPYYTKKTRRVLYREGHHSSRTMDICYSRWSLLFRNKYN